MKTFILFIFLIQPQLVPDGTQHILAVIVNQEQCKAARDTISKMRAPISARCIEVDVYGDSKVIRD